MTTLAIYLIGTPVVLPFSAILSVWMFFRLDDAVVKVQPPPEFSYQPTKGSYNKTKCASYGGYVFHRYVRMVNREPRCIPCAGYDK